MKQGEIQQSLTATNRWWRNPRTWTRQDPDLSEANGAPFRYVSGVLNDLEQRGLYVLRGPRRVGKSVEIKRTIGALLDSSAVDPRCVLHVATDGWRAADLGRLVAAANQLTPAGRRYWFIDEITSIADGWPERIKWLRDNDERFRNDTVVLAGSSVAGPNAAAHVLAERHGPAAASNRFLLPMGFRTFVQYADPTSADLPALGSLRVIDLTPARLVEATQALVPWLDCLVSTWDTYLQVGGFPLALAGHLREHEVPRHFLRSLLDVIQGDAFRRANWSQMQTTALLQRLVQGLCSPVNHAAIADDLDIPQSSVRQRLEDMRDTFALWPCHREDRLRVKPNAQSKVYFLDSAYAHLCATLPDDSQLSEQQLGVALLRCFERERPGTLMDYSEVLHHRSSTRREIDFVGPNFGGLAIESKFVDGRWKRDAQTLAASGWRGVVATRSELDLSDPKGVLAIPTAMLAWLVDN